MPDFSIILLAVLLLLELIGLNSCLNDRKSNTQSNTNDDKEKSLSAFKIEDEGTITRDYNEAISSIHIEDRRCCKYDTKLKAKTNFCPNCGAPLS